MALSIDSKFPRLSFLTKERKNKKEAKMIRLEHRLSLWRLKLNVLGVE